MKVFISADMEGATGVVHMDDIANGRPGYEAARKLMTADVVAAAEGSLAAGAELVVVCDGHGGMRNIVFDELPERVHLVRGPASSKDLCQVEGISSDFDCALFIAYHAMAGTTPAVLSHTWVGSVIQAVHLNGRLVGETGINAALCGHFGVPLVMASGDAALCREAAGLISGIHTVAVKEAVGQTAAICRPAAETESEIRAAAAAAVGARGSIAPFVIEGPVDFDITVQLPATADKAERYTDVERIDERTLRIRADDMNLAVRRAWRTVETLMMQHAEWNQ